MSRSGEVGDLSTEIAVVLRTLRLTDRESAVTRLVMAGHSVGQVAETLSLDDRAVNVVMASVVRKLRASGPVPRPDLAPVQRTADD
jgi:DNA-binding NarL/FixJ family response regulator